MFIENVLGFYDIDASKNMVKWNKTGDGEQGICNLRFGNIVTDIVANNNQLTIKSKMIIRMMSVYKFST